MMSTAQSVPGKISKRSRRGIEYLHSNGRLTIANLANTEPSESHVKNVPFIVSALEFAACSVARMGLSGRLGIRVHGRNGGMWVIDLTRSQEGAQSASEQCFEAAETRISGFAVAFDALLADPTTALTSARLGEFCVDGDRRILKIIGTCLKNLH